MGKGDGCSAQEAGVDLNRNYGVDWQLTQELYKSASDPCFEFYPGKEPFSEPESRAIRDFLASHDDIKFVINFHSNGNSFIWPFNGRTPNDIEKRAPGVLPIMKDIVANANFPPDLVSGNSGETIQQKVGGDTDDYITATYGIPSVTSEIGYANQFIDDWVVKSKEQALDVVKLNGNWVDYVFNNLPKFAA
jgi:carboxypeptidase T